MSTAPFDTALIRRYDQRAPRYTSYPTALQFHKGFDAMAYRRAALLSNESPAKPLSAYVHVPFCASPCFYCGCNKIVTRDPQRGVDYLRRLLREIEMKGALFDHGRRLRQLHLGGGTPTFLKIGQLAEIVAKLRETFRFADADDRECSIEVDPRTVQAETLPGLGAIGFTRLSLGVQDFDPDVQRAVNRLQPAADVHDCVRFARAVGFRSVSFDLIYGLPLQTPATFALTLDSAIEMRPDRLAVYAYAHMPQLFRQQRALKAQQLPSAEVRLELQSMTFERLTAAGYVHIGMDHFALPDDELARALRNGTLHRNFQGYSTLAECDLVGFGVSAIGSTDRAYAQNHKHLADYYRSIDQGRLPIERGFALTVDDRVRREVIRNIMCNGVVGRHQIGRRYALDFDVYFAAELRALAPLAADGLVELDHCIRVTDAGRFFLRNIAAVFDAYLNAGRTADYSQAV